jgi:hypothetical protein
MSLQRWISHGMSVENGQVACATSALDFTRNVRGKWAGRARHFSTRWLCRGTHSSNSDPYPSRRVMSVFTLSTAQPFRPFTSAPLSHSLQRRSAIPAIHFRTAQSFTSAPLSRSLPHYSVIPVIHFRLLSHSSHLFQHCSSVLDFTRNVRVKWAGRMSLRDCTGLRTSITLGLDLTAKTSLHFRAGPHCRLYVTPGRDFSAGLTADFTSLQDGTSP